MNEVWWTLTMTLALSVAIVSWSWLALLWWRRRMFRVVATERGSGHEKVQRRVRVLAGHRGEPVALVEHAVHTWGWVVIVGYVSVTRGYREYVMWQPVRVLADLVGRRVSARLQNPKRTPRR